MMNRFSPTTLARWTAALLTVSALLFALAVLLEHGGESLGLVMEVVLRLRTQRTQGPTKFKQRGAQSLSEFAKRLTIADGSRLGHAIEIVRGDELGVHGQGDGRRQVELSDLLTDITRDELDGRLHFRHHALGFLDAREAMLAEPFVLGNGTSLLDVLLDISGNELAVSTHPALQIDKMVVVANATDTRLDLCTLLSETFVLTTGRFERLLGLLQTQRFFWGAPWTALFGLLACALQVALQSFELLCGFGDGLMGGPLFSRHGSGDCFDQFVLHMEQVW